MHDIDDHGATRLPQHALLAAIVDSSFDAILSKTLDGTITSWNAAAERIFGYTAQETIGRSIEMLMPAERVHEERWILDRLRSGERVENFETVRLHKAGHRIDVAITSSPVRDSDGEIVGASKIVRDISSQRAAATALTESEARLAAIVESAMDAIITVDERGRIIVFNEAAASMLRCTRDAAVGGSLDRFLPERVRDRHASWMTAFGAGERTGRAMALPGRISARRADGGEFPAEASISHARVHGEQLFTVMLRDVSELKEAQAGRRALEDQLREAQKMEAVGTLAGGIAHDINNVLGAILGNVALALEELPEGDSVRLSIEQIDQAAHRARAVVRQILAFSRRQAQELVVQPLGPIVEEAVGLLRSTLPSVVRLETCLPGADLRARVDANQIHQVLLNLCTNAWHALRGSTGVIRVGLERVVIDAASTVAIGELAPGPHLRLWVADNGCGMDAATRSRIFEPFFTTKPRGEGTGLGLAVVHGIVRSHGGAITVESSPGNGTRFDIHLPQAQAPAEATSAPDAATAAGCEGRRVAYVDDDDVMRLMVERLLRRRGFEVECHADPAHLLARLHERPGELDIVVSDFNMPGMTGVELARLLCATAMDLPIIISSGYLSEELRVDASAAGVAALLEKEDTLERLAPLIARVLGEHRDATPAQPLPA